MERDPEKERQKLRKNITEKRWQMGGWNKQGEEKIIVGRRVLYNVDKIKKYLDAMAV